MKKAKMTMINFHKLPEETERQYLWRIGNAIEDGTAGLSWEEATPIINKECRDSEDEYRTSCSYRKPVQCAIQYYNDVFSKMTESEFTEQFKIQRDELTKLKKQFYDQRREYNKLLTDEARSNHLELEIIKCAKKINELNPLRFDQSIDLNENEAVVCFSDWHYGMTTDNIWNKYNTDICKKRLESVVSKMSYYLKKEKPKKIHILLLGDFAHGGIHTSARVASEELVCDQLITVSEMIAQAIDKLSDYSNQTIVYSTYGNHMRTIQNKKESIHGDNMEKIIPWWLKTRFYDRADVNVVKSDLKEFIHFMACGNSICAVHGDLDNAKNLGIVANTIFSKTIGKTIDYVISADKHHNESFEEFGIDSIIVGSLCGSDDYANNKRLYSKPSQSLIIFNENEGEVCRYTIKAGD